MKYEIGKTVEGKSLNLDLSGLLEQRALVTANSGGGKSWLLRVILEQTHGVVPHLIIDPEGEFASLREKYDYLLAGKGGDIPADPNTAAMLARKMLETNASLIVDLYELKKADKHRFVRYFLDALINAPKELWGPRLLVIDEAHEFCPEKGSGTSEAWDSVIDCGERGRKRGLGLILATQRLAKLSKDAASECQNKLIGLANMDIDRQRASQELGLVGKEEILKLRDLEPGEFFAVGRALCKNVQRIKTLSVKTTHPKAGHRMKQKAPAPTSRVKALLEKLKDLPQQAQEEARTMDELRAKVMELEKQIRSTPKVQIAPSPIGLSQSDRKSLEAKSAELTKKIVEEVHQVKNKAIKDSIETIRKVIDHELAKVGERIIYAIPKATVVPIRVLPTLQPHQELRKVVEAKTPTQYEKDFPQNKSPKIGKPERAIVGFMLTHAGRTWSKAQVSVGSGYSLTSSSFANALGALRSAGIISGPGDSMQVNPETAREVLGTLPESPSNASNGFKKNLDRASRMIWEFLQQNEGRTVSKEEIAEGVGYSITSSSFANAIGKLHSLEIIQKVPGGERLNPEISGL